VRTHTHNFVQLLKNTINTHTQFYPHNYYLYSNAERDIRVTWIGFDHNEALQSSGAQRRVPISLAGVQATQWPIVAFVRDDPVLYARYLEALRHIVELPTSYLANPTLVNERIDQLDALYGAAMSNEVYPYGAERNNTHVASVAQLRTILDGVRQDVLQFLAAEELTATTTTATTTADATATSSSDNVNSPTTTAASTPSTTSQSEVTPTTRASGASPLGLSTLLVTFSLASILLY
jgi:hypothetical protein